MNHKFCNRKMIMIIRHPHTMIKGDRRWISTKIKELILMSVASSEFIVLTRFSFIPIVSNKKHRSCQ